MSDKDFTKTETFINLARSFAGECQAGMRYQLIAKEALKQGYVVFSDEIKKIAKNETFHATSFFDKLIEHGGVQENIDISAGYPFASGTVEESLLFAVDAEIDEFSNIYPSFRDIAIEEGFKDVANLYDLVIEVEKQHKAIFEYLHTAFSENTLYKSAKPVVWRCSNCGHEATSKQAYYICPLCKASQGLVELHIPYKKEK